MSSWLQDATGAMAFPLVLDVVEPVRGWLQVYGIRLELELSLEPVLCVFWEKLLRLWIKRPVRVAPQRKDLRTSFLRVCTTEIKATGTLGSF